MKIECVYIIRSKSKLKRVYIGSTINYLRRKREHFAELKKGTHCNKKLLNHVNKYGISDLEMTILEVVRYSDTLIQREQYYIDEYNPFFNVEKNADSPKGIKRSDEFKRLISSLKKGNKYWLGKKHSESTLMIMSEAQKGNKNGIGNKSRLGQTNSIETREKMKKARAGRRPMIGRKHSEEAKEKVRLSLIGNQRCKGNVLTAEHKAKISEGLRRAHLKKLSKL